MQRGVGVVAVVGFVLFACSSSSTPDPAPATRSAPDAGSAVDAAATADAGPGYNCTYFDEGQTCLCSGTKSLGHRACDVAQLNGNAICRQTKCWCSCDAWLCHPGVLGATCDCDTAVAADLLEKTPTQATCAPPGGGVCCYDKHFDSCSCFAAADKGRCSDTTRFVGVPSCNIGDVRPVLVATLAATEKYGDAKLVPECTGKDGYAPRDPACVAPPPSSGGSGPATPSGCDSSTCHGSMGGDGFSCTWFCSNGSCTQQCS